MAAGDAAAAAGMDVVDGATAPANTIDTELNKTRDYIANGAGATSAATANKVIKRDAAGRARIAAPSAADDLVNKAYCDANTPDSADDIPDLPASKITSGTLAVARGGTGATSASAARTALGITPANIGASPTAHTHAASAITSGVFDVARVPHMADLNGNDRVYIGTNPTSPTSSSNNTYIGIGDDVANVFWVIRDGAQKFWISAGGDISAEGNGQFAGAWNNNITSTRRAVWMEDDGTLGHTASARKFKQNIEPAELTEAQLRAIPIVMYRYRAAVARERNGGPRAAVEIGTLADDLHNLGLWQFVVYEGRGDEAVPLSVHYELLALAALALAQQLADRLDTLDERVAVLERNHE